MSSGFFFSSPWYQASTDCQGTSWRQSSRPMGLTSTRASLRSGNISVKRVASMPPME